MAISLLVSGLAVDILSTFCGVFMVKCVTVMVRIFFNFGFYCLTYCLSPKCNLPETFTRYGYYAGEVEDIIISRLIVVYQIAVPNVRAFSCG